MTQRRLLGRHAPHEGTHEVGALDLEGIEQTDRVVGEGSGTWSASQPRQEPPIPEISTSGGAGPSPWIS
jgi:hypothetical protein